MMRAYQQFLMVPFTDSKYTWASTDYTKLFVKSDLDIPSNISTSVDLMTSISTGTGTITHSFMSPDIFDSLAVIDGVLYGNVTARCWVNSTGTASAQSIITAIDIKLEEVESDGTSTTIVEQDLGIPTVAATLGTTVEKGIMFWVPVSHVELEPGNRLKVSFVIHWQGVDTLNQTSRQVGFATDYSLKEMAITMPFVLGA